MYFTHIFIIYLIENKILLDKYIKKLANIIVVENTIKLFLISLIELCV